MYHNQWLATLTVAGLTFINVSNSQLLVDGRRLGENSQEQIETDENYWEENEGEFSDYLADEFMIDYDEILYSEVNPTIESGDSEDVEENLWQPNPPVHRELSPYKSDTTRQAPKAENMRTLKTSLTGRNRSWGNMFDVESLNPITITDMYIHTTSTIYTKFEVWTKSGTHVDFETDPDSWTLLGEGYTIGQGAGYLTPLPKTILFKDTDGIRLEKGETRAFYVRLEDPYMKYDNGNFDFRNSDLIIYHGKAIAKHAFQKNFQPRIWNGAFNYIVDTNNVDNTVVQDTANSDREIFVTLGGRTGSFGIQFDIYAKRNIIVRNFSLHIILGTSNLMIYTKSGSHVDSARTLDVWTEILPLTPLEGEGTMHLTKLPIGIIDPVYIAAGTTQAFYIGASESSIRYSRGQSGLGSMFIENDDVRIMEGTGVGGFPYGRLFSPRVFNGIVHYETVKEAPPSLPPAKVSEDQTTATNAKFSLETTMKGGTKSYGNMFSVVATSKSVTILGMQLHLAESSSNLTMVEVYTKQGYFEGFETDIHSWKRVYFGLVKIQGKSKVTPLVPLNMFTPVNITAGGIQSFYVTSNKPNLLYSRGNSAGSSFASNGEIEVLEGIGMSSYPFKGRIFSPRLFNGIIQYNASGTAMPTLSPTESVPTAPQSPSETPSISITSGNFLEFQTNYVGDNGSFGNMFTVSVKKDMLLKSISIHTKATGLIDVVVFAKAGSFRGSESSAVGWIKILDKKVSGKGYLKETEIPASDFQTIEMCAGNTYSFYITLKDKLIRYTNMSPGSLSEKIENDDLLIRPEDSVGVGRYPFGTVYENRMWNGVLHYTLGSSCSRKITKAPSSFPTVPGQSRTPSSSPSFYPSMEASNDPSNSPSMFPTTLSPTFSPSTTPSYMPLEELFTDFRGDKIGYGVMFDMKAINPIVLNTLDIHVASYESVFVEVYLKFGRFIGYEHNPQVWEKVFSGYVKGNGYMSRTTLPREIFTNVKMCPGEIVGIYTTMKEKKLFHSNIPVDVSNMDFILDLSAGVSVSGFGFDPRNTLDMRRTWNGVIKYTKNADCSPTVSPAPSHFPSSTPSDAPSASPIVSPSQQPTEERTSYPSVLPSYRPTRNPSESPTMFPSTFPTQHPTQTHSVFPSVPPSMAPSIEPTFIPSNIPSYLPTSNPTMKPSNLPSIHPSDHPTAIPSDQPTRLPTSSPSMQPSSNPTISDATFKTSIISSMSLDSDLSDPNSVQSQALRWLVDDEISGRDANIIAKRYAMAVLYFGLGGPESGFAPDWGEPTEVCRWSLIRCLNKEVVDIEIDSEKVNGFLPPEIRYFEFLKTLRISGSSLGGTIPTELGSIPTLTVIDLSSNKLIGTIPQEMATIVSLKTIDLSKNKLTGTIMTEFGTLNNLDGLSLSDNLLTGNIPSEMGQLINMKSHIDVHSNQLTGSIPTEFGQLRDIGDIVLSENSLLGTLPSQLGQITSMKNLLLEKNQLQGTIPTQIAQMTNLQFLSLKENNFSGTISTLLGMLTRLNYIVLSTNNLSSTIPSELGKLSSLEKAYFFENSLTGSMPNEICAHRIYGNQTSGNGALTTLQVDCVIQCDCCSHCF